MDRYQAVKIAGLTLCNILLGVWIASEITPTRRGTARASQPETARDSPIPPAAEVPGVQSRSESPVVDPPRIVESMDSSEPDYHRLAIKVALGFEHADPGRIRATLLEVAKQQEADAVLVYGFLKGQDYRTAFPAGVLEYGRGGKGWGPGTTVPPEGTFKGRQEHDPELVRAFDTRRIVPCSPPPDRPQGVTTARRGNVNYSLVGTLRTAWRNDNMRNQPELLQRQAIALMIAVVRTDVKDPADCEATLDYIHDAIDSW
jgi:hypothetical protein